MPVFKVVACLLGALAVGAAVWMSVAGDAVNLSSAGWWALLALLVPAAVAVGAWRFGD